MSATMVWYVMYTFCHWYKDAGTHCLIILKLQTAGMWKIQKMVYFEDLLKDS